MVNEMPLFEQPIYDDAATHDIKARVARNSTSKIDSTPLYIKAERYIVDNPEVYRLFCKFAWEAINAGRKNISASLITERIRWETTVIGNDEYKINNNYRAYMARKFMEDNPQHMDIFRSRATKKEKGLE